MMSVTKSCGELVARRRRAGRGRRRSPGAEARGAGVPGGHHDDHRLGLLGGDQVVQDETGAAHRVQESSLSLAPCKQVEDRELPLPSSYPGGV